MVPNSTFSFNLPKPSSTNTSADMVNGHICSVGLRSRLDCVFYDFSNVKLPPFVYSIKSHSWC